MKKTKSRRGLSPVVATISLIAMIVIIALIVFLWIRGLVDEKGEKFGKNVELVCDDVSFAVSYGTDLSITNNGNVPIFRMKVKEITEGGKSKLKDLKENYDGFDWPRIGLNPGRIATGYIKSGLEEDTVKIVLLPVLIAGTSEGEKSFVCDERYGYEMNV